MLKNTANFMLFVLLGAVLFVTSCKKDPFSEKDALQAQKELLAQKFGYDLAIANVSLQIQRAGDSARIAIQNLVNKGASDLEKERLAAALSLKLADFNYLLAELRAKDSLSRIQSYVESIGGVRSYQIRVIDFVTKAPINGATVKVLPWGASAFASVKTNSDGLAIMNNQIIDPQAIFYAVDENTGVTSATTMVRRESLSGLTAGTGNPTMEVYRVSAATATTNVTGALRARVDLTNWSSFQNLGAGRSVTVSTSFNGNNGGVSAPTVTWSFAGVTNTSGVYTIPVPRGYDYSISVPTATVMQKMYVNFINGVDNPFTSLTRYDSALVPFTASASFGRSTSPAVMGYYFKLPADSLSGANVNLRDNSTGGFMSTLFSNLSLDIRSASGTRIDTLSRFVSYNITSSSMVINNGWERTTDNFYNYAIRLDESGNRIPDTLAVEFVNLAGSVIIESMPALRVITTRNGKLDKIEVVRETPTSTTIFGHGGRFVMTTNGFTSGDVSTATAYLGNWANYSTTSNTFTTGLVGSSTITRHFNYGWNAGSITGYSAR